MKRKSKRYGRWLLAGGILTLAAVLGIIWCERPGGPWKAVDGVLAYEPQLILDPGHGGMDSGAVSASGIKEKDLNLAIAQKTRMLMKLAGIETVMTRDTDISLNYEEGAAVRKNKQNDLRCRAEVAARFPQSDFISIHMNKFEQSQYAGAQVFYGGNRRAQQLAQLMQDAFRAVLDPSNDRKIKPAPDSVYIMKKITAPAVIAECGFLSNPQEAEKLAQDDYQTKAALVIVGSYLQFSR